MVATSCNVKVEDSTDCDSKLAAEINESHVRMVSEQPAIARMDSRILAIESALPGAISRAKTGLRSVVSRQRAVFGRPADGEDASYDADRGDPTTLGRQLNMSNWDLRNALLAATIDYRTAFGRLAIRAVLPTSVH